MTTISSITRATLRAAGRELGWGLRAVRREHHRWLRVAGAVPDARLRRQAVEALQDKRPLLDGAALFWTLTERRDVRLLRLLVAFQVLANYHDHASERVGARIQPSGPGSDIATFVEVVDLERAALSYRPTATHRDGGYLAALVDACRHGCRQLPGYDRARPHLLLAVRRAGTLDLEHLASPDQRQVALERFARVELAVSATGLSWFELAAGASSLLTGIVTLALAARPDADERELERANQVYVLVATVSALLDNFVDHAEDELTGAHNYLNYYASFEDAVARLAVLIDQMVTAVDRLDHADRHRVIVAAMLAMYLTTDGARARDPSHRRALVDHAGPTAKALMPALAAWRGAMRQRGT